MNARQLMTPHPAVIAADETLATAAELMRTRNVGMLPVVDTASTRRLVGVITDRDIAVRAVARDHGPAAKVREHMSREPLVTVTPTATTEVVAEQMRQYQVRRLPVVDAQGTVIGVIAQADLALSVGPKDPLLVERTLEGISRPGALVAHA